MRKIFFIGPVPPPAGGVSIHLQRLASVISATNDLQCFIFDIGRRRFFDQHLNRKSLFTALLFFLSCDIVHIHISHRWKILAARISKVFGKKVVYTRHNIRSADLVAESKFHKLCNAAIYVSLRSSEIPDAKTYLIPAYIPAKSTATVNSSVTQILDPYQTIIAAVSSHPSDKAALIDGRDVYGFDLLLHAFSLLKNDDSQVLLLFDHTARMENTYSLQIAELKRRGKNVVYFTGSFDLSAVLENISVYVRPTRTDGDSIAVREALEAGVKVLASDCVPRPNDVHLFGTGIAETLKQELELLLNKPDPLPLKQPDFSHQLLDLYRKL